MLTLTAPIQRPSIIGFRLDSLVVDEANEYAVATVMAVDAQGPLDTHVIRVTNGACVGVRATADGRGLQQFTPATPLTGAFDRFETAKAAVQNRVARKDAVLAFLATNGLLPAGTVA